MDRDLTVAMIATIILISILASSSVVAILTQKVIYSLYGPFVLELVCPVQVYKKWGRGKTKKLFEWVLLTPTIPLIWIAVISLTVDVRVTSVISSYQQLALIETPFILLSVFTLILVFASWTKGKRNPFEDGPTS